MRLHTILAALLLALFMTAAQAHAAQGYKLAVTDLEGMEELQREFGKFRDVLSEKSGYGFELFPVNNRTAAVEALKAKRVDFVITGPAEYVVFRKRTEAVPVVGFSRPDYFASIIVMADSGIASLQDLKGRKVAFGDVGSTSKHLAPMQIFSDNGVNPLKDLSAVYVDQKVGWNSLKRGDVAALGTTNDKFLSMRGKDELPAGSFIVLGRSRDLPSDILLAGSHVDPAVAAKLREVFAKDAEVLVQAILSGEDNQKYKGMKFLTSVKDADYNYVRSMYKTIGYPQYSDFVGN